MKKRFFYVPIACIIALLIVGCAGMNPPMNEITDAKMALERAKVLDAESLAPLCFLEAKEKLKKAESAVKGRMRRRSRLPSSQKRMPSSRQPSPRRRSPKKR